MKEKLKEHIRLLFADAERRAPENTRLAELKEELLLNTLEKYDHLVATGRTPEAAYAAAVNGIGDIGELLDDVIGGMDAQKEGGTPLTTVGPADGNEVDEEGEEADEDGEEKDGKRPPRSPWYKLACGIIWTVVLVAYFVLSFTTHAWHVTWLLFIMGIAADNVAEGIFDLRR